MKITICLHICVLMLIGIGDKTEVKKFYFCLTFQPCHDRWNRNSSIHECRGWNSTRCNCPFHSTCVAKGASQRQRPTKSNMHTLWIWWSSRHKWRLVQRFKWHDLLLYLFWLNTNIHYSKIYPSPSAKMFKIWNINSVHVAVSNNCTSTKPEGWCALNIYC